MLVFPAQAIPSVIFPPFCWMWTANYVVRIGLSVVFRCQAFYSCTSFVMMLYVCSSWLNEVCFEVEHIIYVHVYIFMCIYVYVVTISLDIFELFKYFPIFIVNNRYH